MRILLPALPVLFLACSTHANDPCSNDACYSGRPVGPLHGMRSDKRVDVTAAQAWPGRPAEPPGLSATERARACVTLGACLLATDNPALLTALCVGPDGSEERAIPSGSKAERRSFVLRSALAGGQTCTQLKALDTPRPEEINCEEAGCWWTSLTKPIPVVTCAGEVATLRTGSDTLVRDCSRSYQKCDARSATGCTDRHPVLCDAGAWDRCDGDIKLGCDHNARVSFRDCSRIKGGTCKENADGSAGCVYPNAGTCSGGAATCTTDGKGVLVCVDGEPTTVDCASVGYKTCASGQCVN